MYISSRIRPSSHSNFATCTLLKQWLSWIVCPQFVWRQSAAQGDSGLQLIQFCSTLMILNKIHKKAIFNRRAVPQSTSWCVSGRECARVEYTGFILFNIPKCCHSDVVIMVELASPPLYRTQASSAFPDANTHRPCIPFFSLFILGGGPKVFSRPGAPYSS